MARKLEWLALDLGANRFVNMASNGRLAGGGGGKRQQRENEIYRAKSHFQFSERGLCKEDLFGRADF